MSLTYLHFCRMFSIEWGDSLQGRFTFANTRTSGKVATKCQRVKRVGKETSAGRKRKELMTLYGQGGPNPLADLVCGDQLQGGTKSARTPARFARMREVTVYTAKYQVLTVAFALFLK